MNAYILSKVPALNEYQRKQKCSDKKRWLWEIAGAVVAGIIGSIITWLWTTKK